MIQRYATLYGVFPPSSTEGMHGGTVTVSPDPPYAAQLIGGATYPLQPITGYINKDGRLSHELTVPAIVEGGIYPQGDWTWTVTIRRPWLRDPIVKHVVLRPGRYDINALPGVPMFMGSAGAVTESAVTVGLGKPTKDTKGGMYVSTDGAGVGAWVWAKTGRTWSVIHGKSPRQMVEILNDQGFRATIMRTAEIAYLETWSTKDDHTTESARTFIIPDGFSPAYEEYSLTTTKQNFESTGAVTLTVRGNGSALVTAKGTGVRGIQAGVAYPVSSVWPGQI